MRHRSRFRILACLVCAAGLAGAAAGSFVRLDMPSLRRLETYDPPEMTRILAHDGSEIASFASEKRIVLGHGEIPDSFRHALIASEDSRFARHTGVDPVGVLRAIYSDLRSLSKTQGASTLTMQLAGNLFLDRSQRTVRRKLQEAYLATEIERAFSKQEILRMYSNHVHFGHGLYGLEAAARYYFDKPARALTIGESATLVGLLPRPAGYSPYRDMERATQRRDLVLGRMVAEGYLAPDIAQKITVEPIVVARRETPVETASYFNEEVRRWIGNRYGDDALYRGGLVVTTTLVPELQRIAERAIENGLSGLDGAQGALVAIDPANGEILALVGGADFRGSEYNRATQARRQPGSLFKTFVYAAALDRGWTLADALTDEPTVFRQPHNPEPYQPENFDRRYRGSITLRAALEKSINIPAVRLLERIGYGPVIDTARALGVDSPLRPYPSLALGAFEVTLLEVTSAYGAFANQGLRFEPHSVRQVADRYGRVVHEARPGVTEAVSAQVAYLINQALAGVIRRGTGRSAGAALARTLAGKTGTTDDNTDAWFVGYSTRLVVGVWVGHDEPRSLGPGRTGAGAALPIWIDFMREALDGVPDEAFPEPSGVTTRAVDPHSGLLVDSSCGESAGIAEAFIEGTEPAVHCSPAQHRRLLLPYPLHRYQLDPHGTLMVPADALRRLLRQEPDLRLDDGGELVARTRDGFIRVPLRVLPDLDADDGPTEERFGADGRTARVIHVNAE